MNNKKIAPVAMLTLLLTACPATPTTGNPLVDYMNSLEVGALKRKEVDHIFKKNLLKSNDKAAKSSTYREILFTPYWSMSEGLEESEYAENVKKSDRSRSYKVYDNNIVLCHDDSTVYPYDKSTISEDDDTPDGIAKEPVVYSGDASIWHDEAEDQLRYVYTRNNDVSNKYSFEAHADFDDYLFDDVIHDGGMGDIITQSKEDVEDTFSMYAGAWGDMTRKETYSAVKNEDGSISIDFVGDLCMDLYSAEFLWGWEFEKDIDGEDDYERPKKKETSDFDNMYVDRRIRFSYNYQIDPKGFVTSGRACYFSYLTRIYFDSLQEFSGNIYHETKNPEGILKRDLDKSTIDALQTPGRLVDVEYIGGKKNPYLNTEFDDGMIYNIDYFNCSGESNGDYSPELLPDYSGYRAQFDMVDTGVWVDAYELFMEEH